LWSAEELERSGVYAGPGIGAQAFAEIIGLRTAIASAMECSRELRDKVSAGSITVSFRLWQRQQVRVGGIYAVRDVHIQVDAIDVIPFYGISDADVRRAGERDRESLRRRAAHAGPISDDTVLYRVEFHVV
jgi:hypothetical protein